MNIVAVGAHGDDVELGMGGTICKAADAGHNVLILVMSDSGFTKYDGTVLRTSDETVAESLGAANLLRASVKLLPFQTKDIRCESATVEAINSIIDGYKPDYIFTHSPFDTHPDHEATSKATIAAARNYENILFYEPFPPSGRSYVAFRPQVYVDITTALERKVAAIKSHVSQANRYGEEWTDSIIARARLRGYEANVRYAETFELLRIKIAL